MANSTRPHRLIGAKNDGQAAREKWPTRRSATCGWILPTNATVENYRRDLDLDTAVAGVSYTANGVHFKREIFSSAPSTRLLVVRLTADKPGQISFTAGLTHAAKGRRERGTQSACRSSAQRATLVIYGVNGAARCIRAR